MRAGSIFESVKVKEIEVSMDEYVELSLSGKSDYVAALIRSFRENISHHAEILEAHFKKNPIKVADIELIEQEFSLWVELVYETLFPFVLAEHFDESYLWGPEMDELIDKYIEPEKENEEIPKDELLEYVERIREFLKVAPLKASILNKLKTSPQMILSFRDEDIENKYYEKAPDNFSEGIVMITGERIELTYPFYTVAKYLEKKKSFSEESAISQNQIHKELKLPFKEPRLKQWKKIKGRTNPIIFKVFNTSSRGLIWLKNNVKII